MESERLFIAGLLAVILISGCTSGNHGTQPSCKDECGNGLCQEIVCMAIGCPCAESSETCPQDCSDVCIKQGTQSSMRVDEARQIAQASACVSQGALKGSRMCNENSGTWWFDLDINKSGCAPACVVDVSTKAAEINWRCTGAIPPQ